MILESIRNFMLQCPYLEEMAPVYVDYLDNEAVSYTIDSIPNTPVIKEYTDGSKLKQFLFVFGSREFYGPDYVQNIENSGVFEKISAWFDDMTENNSLPALSDGKIPIKIETVSSGYVFGTTADTARYQIQARLIYYEE